MWWPFKKSKPRYVYGTAGPDVRRARKDTTTGAVEFVMWKAGEQGHAEDWWIAFHPYWWTSFLADDDV